MKLDKLDRLIIDGEQVIRLDEWWMNIHQGDSNYIPPVLEEGLIILKPTNEQLSRKDIISRDLQVYFKQLNEDEVYYEIYRTDMSSHTFEVLRATKNYRTLKSDISIETVNHLGITSENAIRFLDSVTTSHVSLMNYMALYKDVRERVSSRTMTTFPSNKNKKKKKKIKNVRPITTVVYSVHFPTENVTEQEKKEYNRMKEAWKVRGHWRELKSGKMVWIKPYVKGNKDKVEPVTYII